MLLPETAEQVSCILRHCYSRRLAVVPQSGNTGLVGGSVPVFDEVVVSTKKLNKAYALDASAGNTGMPNALTSCTRVLQESSNATPASFSRSWTIDLLRTGT